MATYTPKALVPVTQLSVTGGTAVYAQGGGGIISVIRTIFVLANAAARTFTLSIGADAAATRLFDAYALTQSVPAVFNGWWVIPAATGAHAIDANASNATSVQLSVGGLEFV